MKRFGILLMLSDRRPTLWTAFWFCMAMFLLGVIYSAPAPKPLLPFDIQMPAS
ncbi:MAG TPA: hypothetical protein VII95_21315 [Terriglobales bacterium]